MHFNPVKRGLVESPKEWEWSSYRLYWKGEKGLCSLNPGWQPRAGATATACAGEAAQEVNDAEALIYVAAEATTYKARARAARLREVRLHHEQGLRG